MAGSIVVVVLVFAAAATLGTSLPALLRRLRDRRQPAAPEPEPERAGIEDANAAAAARALAAALMREERFYEGLTILDDPRVAEVVEALARTSVPVSVPWGLARSRANIFEPAFGIAALRRREDAPAITNWAFAALKRCAPPLEPLFYALLLERADAPIIARALALCTDVDPEELARFIAARREHEEVGPETFAAIPGASVQEVKHFIAEHGDILGADLGESFERWRATAVDSEFLGRVGKLWAAPFDRPETLLVGDRAELVEQMVEALQHDPPRSLLIVGDHGVGKTALLRAALDRVDRPLVVFEASAATINAGAMYVGQLEGRAKEVVDRLRSRNVVWVMPQLQEALYAGQHSKSPQGLLDALLPHVEAGEICMIGEVGPAEFEALNAARPRIASAFDVIRVRSLGERESIDVVHHALAGNAVVARASQDTLAEAYELAQQFLPGIAAPGNTLRLVTAASAEVIEEGRDVITSVDVLTTLAATSGLPLTMLDPSMPLPLADVRAFFEERVLGQGDAVSGVVERISIARAGLNDPSRPLGVLLLVGPTGTGKTELAKALAEFMFGSASRLVRVDMSEFQTPSSMERLLSDTNVDRSGAPLIAAVRKDPFSVVLLDEFEKSSPQIWDLFLQVFDDGRLTDTHGRVVDFRRCVFLLTSNIGSSIATGTPVGFDRAPDAFRPARVEDAVRKSFRPEFLNRIDRVIVFRPFELEQMRQLLQKELREVLTRRGLRARPWAVELDESAAEFIIAQGFTPDLGARPLKRAVERHLLAPLAEVIVEQTAPTGDQFLFVSYAEATGIKVSFVDLESGDDSQLVPLEPDVAESGPLDLRALALSGRANRQQVHALLGELERVAEVAGGSLQERKQVALAALGREGFWEEENRFATLSEAEYIDRLQAATVTAQNLGVHLSSATGEDGGVDTGNVVSLLALRLLVLRAALDGLAHDAPAEVYLRVRPAEQTGGAGEEWANEILVMYEMWALGRGMQIERIGEERLCLVSGLGAGQILLSENGLHVLELVSQNEQGDRHVERLSCVVEVVPREAVPEGERTDAVALANAALAHVAPPSAVVRRYRPRPTPLVRDAVRGYRTGRLDRVLAGDFDLFGAEQADS
jgi:ATP-dependent Clp protease ATP-binding subunit ClpC